MSPTIKGPIKIKGNDMAKLLNMTDTDIKLPFTATNFRCTEIPNTKLLDSEGKEFKPTLVSKEEINSTIPVPVSVPAVPVLVAPKPTVAKLTKEKLLKINKAEQEKILINLGVDKKKIPKTEKDRISMILKLQ